MRIGILGGMGYIGSMLIPQFVKSFPGCKIDIVDNLLFNQVNVASYLASLPNVNFYNLDCNEDKYLDLIGDWDWICPLHALVGAPICSLYPELATQTNLDSIAKLMNNLAEDQCVLGVNTNSAYGTTPENVVCDENSPLSPISLYANTKQEAEYLIRKRKNSVVFRLATVYGLAPRMRYDLLVNDFCWTAANNDILTVFEGNFRRNFVHVEDVANAFVFAIDNWDKVKGEVFNLGDDAANRTKYELAQLICDINDCKMVVDENKVDLDRRSYTISSNRLYSKGYKISKVLEEEIAKISQFSRQISPSLKGVMSNV